MSRADGVTFRAKRYAFFSCRQKTYEQFPCVLFGVCCCCFFLKEDYSGCCVEMDDWKEERLEVCTSVGKRGGQLTPRGSLL